MRKKKLIEQAYTLGEQLGIGVWCQDEAGPFQTVPYAGSSWERQEQPRRLPHEYIRNGTAKLLTLLHPATGVVRVKGVLRCTNTVLHPWLKEQLTQILSELPPLSDLLSTEEHADKWKLFGARHPEQLPALRLIVVLDNLAGHTSWDLVSWLYEHGILPLYTPLGGSWLNMAESIQRIVIRRALAGQEPQTPQQIIDWLEAVSRAWNRQPTPFVWGGKRASRRLASRQRQKLHAVGGSGACTHQPVPTAKRGYA